MLHGGRLGLCAPRGTLNLLSQIRCVAPTTLSAAPRFYSLYFRRFEDELASLQRQSPQDSTDTRRSALATVRGLGGPRLRLVAVGGAVVPPALLRFLKDCLTEMQPAPSSKKSFLFFAPKR